MDLRFRTWNVRNLNRAGSLKTIAKVLAKYIVGIVAVQGDSQQTFVHFCMEIVVLIVT
jgi:hypothetical protein